MIVRHGAGVVRMPLLDALARGPEWWDAIVAASGITSPFMRWAWHDAWARSAPRDELAASFAIVVGDSGAHVSGLLPLALRPVLFRRTRATALTWAIGDVGCPDHLDLPLPPQGHIEDIVALLMSLPWDLVVLGGVADAAAHVPRLVEGFTRRGLVARRALSDVCPRIDLPGSWDAYLAGLSAARRQTIRRRERKLSRGHDVAISDYAPDRVEEGWRWLLALHEARWGGPGAVGHPRLASLLRRCSATLAARDELWLTTLDLDGEPVAAWHGFAHDDTVFFYQSGRDPARDPDSVGMVLMGTMIRRAIERGYRYFDLLRGDDPYKRDWGAVGRPIHEIVIFRPGWRGMWLRALDWVARARARRRSRREFAGADAHASSRAPDIPLSPDSVGRGDDDRELEQQ